jgi:polyhydroxybutyrate depolymerase
MFDGGGSSMKYGQWLSWSLGLVLACSHAGSADAQPAAAATPPAPVATFAPAPAFAPGNYDLSIPSGGLTRSYILHVPRGYDGSRALPLVFVLHGVNGTAQQMESGTGWDTKADQEGILVAYLQGTRGTGSVTSGWNSGLWPASGVTADDVGFVRDLVGSLGHQLRVDPLRVYAVGFSNGAWMAHRLGAALPDVLAAVAVVEGTVGIRQPSGQFSSIPAPIAPVPIVIFHGEKDDHLLYNGGVAPGGYHLDAKPASASVSLWTQGDHCSGAPNTTRLPDGNLLADYTACANGSEVAFYTLVDGVHQYPTLSDPAKLAGTPVIWSFFSRHTRPLATVRLP